MAKQPAKPTEAQKPADDGRIDYVVTENAPSRVAGQRVSAGTPIRLTEHEALAEELAGHIRRPDAALKAPEAAVKDA